LCEVAFDEIGIRSQAILDRISLAALNLIRVVVDTGDMSVSRSFDDLAEWSTCADLRKTQILKIYELVSYQSPILPFHKV
jgi:hypothetical protein